jgi:hypothetical protein
MFNWKLLVTGGATGIPTTKSSSLASAGSLDSSFTSLARQIQFVDEDVDHTHRVVLDDKVVKTLGQQRNLGSPLPFDESLHAAALKKPDASV